MSRPVLIGEAPGRGGSEHCHPLYPVPRTSAGGRLYAMTPFADIPGGRRRYTSSCIRLNLVPEYPESRWPSDLAVAQAANFMRGDLFTGRRVVLVGKRVLNAFMRHMSPGLVDPCTFFFDGLGNRARIHDYKLGYMPHPSGRNLWYNDADNVALARSFLREVFT